MKILVTYAIPQEKINVSIPDAEIIYLETGIGKVNAATNTQAAIYQNKPDMVINLGTAGSVHHPVGDILVCSEFWDRDMEKAKDFGVNYQHSFHEDVAKLSWFKHMKANHVCNSGDSFLTSQDGSGDVFDMEVFGIAKVCKDNDVPLVSVKYVTDKIGENSQKHWEDKLHDANVALQAFFDKL